jgi:hypothetical protein
MSLRPRVSKSFALSFVTAAGVALCACAGSAPDPARYPAREPGCAVKAYPGDPRIPVDELGVVHVDCDDPARCERKLLDEVCRRGGDVAWGTGGNALNAAKLDAHAAHSRRAAQGPRARGCEVQVFTDAPPMRTENVGPVTALCAETDTREACLRELQDQACLLGGDVLWQVDGPTPEATSNGTGQRMRGRAAHTK